MASDSYPSHEGRKKKKKMSDGCVKSKDKEADVLKVQVDIEELTASGHIALKQGDCKEAISCFKKAFKASIEVTLLRLLPCCPF